MVEQLWIAPAEALARGASLKLLTPTQKTLETVARFADVGVADGLGRGAARRSRWSMPRIANGREGLRPVLPDEPAWAELGRIDPAGHGHGSLRHRQPTAPVRLSPRVIRVTRRQRQRHDRARHQHLSGRRRAGRTTGR